ncbi:MAG TPA: helix-hairpin-helix domain-containing protein [Lachnospiraceae bacterium]|nr:helix-hairpin-helix domain-containing protein [Lachnospiraceae bacterium]
MDSKKLIKAVVTVLLIGIAGILYYFSGDSNADSGIVLANDVEERDYLQSDDGNDSHTKEKTEQVKGQIQNTDIQQSSQTQDSLVDQVKESMVGESNEQEEQQPNGQPSEEAVIFVHVCGQVKKAGVYKISKDSRVSDAIEAAGGLTKKAAGDAINQAQKVNDGERIYIPSQKEVEAGKVTYETNGNNASSTEQQTNSKLININKATKEELMSLPGIGESKADMIITYRNEHGAFAKIEDIKNITGIKDGVFQKICDLITTD